MKTAKLDSGPESAYWALRVFFGAVPIVAGLDKYFNLLTDWTVYVNPVIVRIAHLSPAAFLHSVGIIEIVAGIVVLSRWSKVGSYVVMLWLLGIAVNLLLMGKFLDVAVRDIGLAIGAFTLAQLIALRDQSSSATDARIRSAILARG